MKKLFASILCLGMIFGATGCTSGGDDTYEIAMITDSGSVTDKSFNQSAYEGVKEFGEKNDISYKYYAPKDTDQAGLLSTIDDAVDNGAKVVLTPVFNSFGLYTKLKKNILMSNSLLSTLNHKKMVVEKQKLEIIQ